MKQALSQLFGYLGRGPIGKAARHLLALGAGWIAAHPAMAGYGMDPQSVGSILVALGVFVVVLIWSVATKKALSLSGKQTVQLVMEALVAHALPVLAGLMAAKGYQGNPDDAGAVAEWLGAGALGWLLSVMSRPDAKPSKDAGMEDDWSFGAGGASLWLLCLCVAGAGLMLTSCAGLRDQDDWTVRACLELPVGSWLAPDRGAVDAGLFPSK